MDTSPRREKIAELLRQKVAFFIEKESNNKSLITVTRCTASKDLKRATVYITVLPRNYEDHALDFVKRNLHELREYIKKNTKLRSLPFFSVEIDFGELNRQRIDELSTQDSAV